MISIDSVVKQYSPSVRIGSISLDIPAGGITALVGPNGAGKSTLLTMIGRLLGIDEGTIEVGGLNVATTKSSELARTLSILRQENHFISRLTVRQLVGFGRFPHSKGRLNAKDEAIIDRYIGFIMADRLTAVSLGEDIAVSLGVNYHRMVLIATGLVAVATGVVTVVVGSLPFLGLIVPNLVSMTMGDNLRTNLPWVCLAGIALVTVTDLLARTIISPFEMPVSVILGVLGAFVFIALVLRQAKKGATL